MKDRGLDICLADLMEDVKGDRWRVWREEEEGRQALVSVRPSDRRLVESIVRQELLRD